MIPLRGQQEVHSGASFVDRPVQAPPDPIHSSDAPSAVVKTLPARTKDRTGSITAGRHIGA